MSKRRKKKRQKLSDTTKQLLSPELKETIDAIVDRLKAPVYDLPFGVTVEYQISDHFQAFVHLLRQKLPFIGHRAPQEKKPNGHLLLWHGTSLARARSILDTGFRARRKQRGVFFSTNVMTSFSYADRRALTQGSEPAIFAAHYDVSTSKHTGVLYEHHVVETHYIFGPATASRIVTYLLTCNGFYSTGKLIDDADKYQDNLTDIEITQSTGTAGIAYWLNSFLGLGESDCILADHPAVQQIQAWVAAEYERGRMTPIADEEILAVARTCLPQRFDSHVDRLQAVTGKKNEQTV